MSFVTTAARRIENFGAKLQGKGKGSRHLGEELSSAAALLGSPPRIIVDIGANRGHYIQAVRQRWRLANIYAFEPSSTNVEILNTAWGSYDNVKVVPFAASDHEGSVILYSDEQGSSLASLTKCNLDHYDICFDQTERVQSIRFETYWNEQLNLGSIDLDKLDIEGHELSALNGFGEALKNIKLIQFEFGGCNIDTRIYWRDFWYYFSDRNFDFFRITMFGPSPVDAYDEIDEHFRTTIFLALNQYWEVGPTVST